MRDANFVEMFARGEKPVEKYFCLENADVVDSVCDPAIKVPRLLAAAQRSAALTSAMSSSP
jgi:hypothetical protein